MNRRNFVKRGAKWILAAGASIYLPRNSLALPLPWNAGLQPLITGQVLGTSRNNYTGAVGLKFLCITNCTVRALGMWVTAGSTQTDCVSLYNADQEFWVASVTIVTPGLGVGYKYVLLSAPQPLTTPHHYALCMETTSGGDSFYDENTTITVDSNFANMDASSGAQSATGSCPESWTFTQQNLGSVTYGPVNLLVSIP